MKVATELERTYALGFTDQLNERTNERALCRGKIPDWLRGSLYRNGPARFTLPDGSRIRHWFDGFAMVHRFHFAQDGVFYSNRFLQSNYYTESLRTGRMVGLGFSGWKMSPLEKLRSFFRPMPGDNADVHFQKLGKELVALTEVTQPVAFDPVTLETRGVLRFDDPYKAPLMLAHVHRDPLSGGWLNYMLDFGRVSSYRLFRVRPGETRREIIASLPVEKPAYMHSFSVAGHYAILVEPPFRINPLGYMLGRAAFADAFRWEADHASTFRIIDLETGREKRLFGPPFFSFHHVNAYEEDSCIILDLIAYADSSVVQAMDIERITNLPEAGYPSSLLTRLTLDLSRNTVTSQIRSNISMELPRIHYARCNGKPYRYGYAAITSGSCFLGGLVKWDVVTGREWRFEAEGVFPAEPVFVPTPGGKDEDEGVVLSVALLGDAQRSALLILDARTFEEVARVEVPQVIPYGFHGIFLAERQEQDQL